MIVLVDDGEAMGGDVSVTGIGVLVGAGDDVAIIEAATGISVGGC